jgi:hypothetical protein
MHMHGHKFSVSIFQTLNGWTCGDFGYFWRNEKNGHMVYIDFDFWAVARS